MVGNSWGNVLSKVLVIGKRELKSCSVVEHVLSPLKRLFNGFCPSQCGNEAIQFFSQNIFQVMSNSFNL